MIQLFRYIIKEGLRMRNLPSFLFRCSLFAFLPVAANAAGTYYTGYYQSPQQSYSSQSPYAQRQTGYSQYNRNYTTPSYSSTRYTQTNTGAATANQARTSTSSATTSSSSSKKGFWLDAGISRETAMWQFEMKNAGSILHYDNLSWNVLDVAGGYSFDVGSMNLAIDAGLKYGMQSGESSMIDDDVSNGGSSVSYCESIDEQGNCINPLGTKFSNVVSLGTSKGGTMLGFYAGIGLTDLWKWGNVKFTPSVGYRHLSYNLKTESNYGLAVDTWTCFELASGELQCDPILIFVDSSGNTNSESIPNRDNPYYSIPVPGGSVAVDTEGTYYFYQPGESHNYDVAWSGPYVALDMDYVINQNNAVNGRVELGLPGYTATGDQPYRFDWQHPKSVEDKAGIGSGFHFGFGANWTTAITNSVALSIGLTYDYYSVRGADAITYLNGDFYTTELNRLLAGGTYELNGYTLDYGKGYSSVEEMLADSDYAQTIVNLENSCPGWICSDDGEIESFYKSMGIRVGINATF